MTYLINPDTRHRLGYCHMTDHVSLACLLSVSLWASCLPLLPKHVFWWGKVQLLTNQANSASSSVVSPWSALCWSHEGWILTIEHYCLREFLKPRRLLMSRSIFRYISSICTHLKCNGGCWWKFLVWSSTWDNDSDDVLSDESRSRFCDARKSGKTWRDERNLRM